MNEYMFWTNDKKTTDLLVDTAIAIGHLPIIYCEVEDYAEVYEYYYDKAKVISYR